MSLTTEANTVPGQRVGGVFALGRIQEPRQISAAIESHAPQFLCFEFDEPDEPGLKVLAQTRRAHPGLPVLMITGCHSEAVALWALRIRVWDLRVKPLSSGELSECIRSLIELPHQGATDAHRSAPLLLPHGPEILPPAPGPCRPERTCAAIAHVAAHFDRKIALPHVAALCRLSASQFCRVFRHEQGVSFAQYLLRYRLERACEGLTEPGVLAKEVAYSVGFNDLAYFSRAFRRQIGVCPSAYQTGARLS